MAGDSFSEGKEFSKAEERRSSTTAAAPARPA